MLKPRVMSLVAPTEYAGLIVASGNLHPLLAAALAQLAKWDDQSGVD